MKIAINGSLVNTEDIYKITKVKAIKLQDDGLGTFWEEEVCDHKADIFQFEVFIYNRSNSIECRISNTDNGNKEKLMNIREELFTLWSNNKLNILQFNCN